MAVIVSFSIVIAKKRSEMKTALAKKRVLQKELVLLSKKNIELHELRDALVYDPVQVEKEAREQLGYGKPEEKSYKTYNFRVVDGTAADEPQPDDESTGIEDSFIKKIGLSGIFILIIISAIGAFYGTYWYESEYRRIHS
jgi:hypothetical protein